MTANNDATPSGEVALPVELDEDDEDLLEDPPEFSEEQLAYLEVVFRIPCCHTTGMHDPDHWQNGDYTCSKQTSSAFHRGIEELGLNPPIVSDDDCGWCQEYYPERDETATPKRRLFEDGEDDE